MATETELKDFFMQYYRELKLTENYSNHAEIRKEMADLMKHHRMRMGSR